MDQISVTSMTVSDEILLRIPDSLLNGHTTVEIIQNCCPSIADAWQIPLCDLNVILAGIRIASDNDASEITLSCPKCKNFHSYVINLQNFLDTYQNKWKETIELLINDSILIINFTPPIFKQVNEWNLKEFRINRQVVQLDQSADIDYKESSLLELFDEKNKLEIEKLLTVISCIRVNNQIDVVDAHDISEFINNSNGSIINTLQSKFDELMLSVRIPNFNVTCASEHCHHDMTINLDLDYCNNFRNQILMMPESDIIALFKKMANQIKELRSEMLKMIWFMRGSLSYSEAMMLSKTDRELIANLIKENIETTKKTQMPFF